MPSLVPKHREVILGSGVARARLRGRPAPPAHPTRGRAGPARRCCSGVFPGNLKMADDARRSGNTEVQGDRLRSAAAAAADDPDRLDSARRPLTMATASTFVVEAAAAPMLVGTRSPRRRRPGAPAAWRTRSQRRAISSALADRRSRDGYAVASVPAASTSAVGHRRPVRGRRPRRRRAHGSSDALGWERRAGRRPLIGRRHLALHVALAIGRSGSEPSWRVDPSARVGDGGTDGVRPELTTTGLRRQVR